MHMYQHKKESLNPVAMRSPMDYRVPGFIAD